MSEYFNHDSLTRYSKARSPTINALINTIAVAFGKLPTLLRLTQNRVTHATGVSGGANSIALTMAHPITAYADGQRFTFTALYSNSGSTTVNVDGVGPLAVTRYDGAVLQANDILAGSVPTIVCVGASRFQLDGLRGPAGATGDVSGAGSSVDGAEALFSGVSGSALKQSSWTEDGAGNKTAGGNLNMENALLTAPQLASLSMSIADLGDVSGTVEITRANTPAMTATMTGDTTFDFTSIDAATEFTRKFHIIQGGAGGFEPTWCVDAAELNVKLMTSVPDYGGQAAGVITRVTAEVWGDTLRVWQNEENV